jgi:hypothetical protein
MKKVIAGIMVGTIIFCTLAPSQAEPAKSEKGGVKGFLSGCCFGTRGAVDFNTDGTGDRDFLSWFVVGCCLGGRAQIDYADGKDIHWREFCRVFPYVGVVFMIWDGVDGANGVTRADIAEKYGSIYY